jgi:crotonobetainyl-CoA:carnitine CoA-transferase CaiB-like acyl-CoA transferase
MKYKFLEGTKVVELGRVLSAPYGSKLLSDMGAEVTKLEAGEGDPYRELPPKVGSQSVWFLNFNEGKNFVHINDLADWQSNQKVLNLIKSADILIENFRPGLLKKYSLDFQSIKKLNPKIVYVSISAFGQEGSLSGKPGFDIVVQALSGYMLNYDTNEVIHPHTYLSDYASGLFAAFAAVSVLSRKDREATYVDISMFDILVNWASIFSIISHHDPRFNDLLFRMDPVAFPYGAFKSKDGKNLAIAAVGPGMVRRFYEGFEDEFERVGLEYEDFLEPAKLNECRTKLTDVLGRKSLSDISKILNEHRIPWEEIKSGLSLMKEQNVVDKNLFEDVLIEGRSVKVGRIPVKVNNCIDAQK